MKTNLLNDLSNVVKKGTGLACSWSQIGRMSEEGAIEQPLSTHSAPFGTRWKQAGEKGSTRVWKHVAMIFAVLVMSVGHAWGTETVLKTIDFSTWGATTFSQGNTETADVHNGVTFYSKSSSKQFSFDASKHELTFPGNNGSSSNYGFGFLVEGINNGTIIIRVYNGENVVLVRTNVVDGATSFDKAKIPSSSSSEKASYPFEVVNTGLSNANNKAYVYLSRQSGDYTKITKIVVSTPALTNISESHFYQLYNSSNKTAIQLVTTASLPDYIDVCHDLAIDDGKTDATTVSEVTTPHNFAGLSKNTKYYRLKMGQGQKIYLHALANVKSIRLYGNGNGGTRSVTCTATKISGTGTAPSISLTTFANAATKVAEYSTGDLTGKSGYNTSTYYNYVFTIPNTTDIWGIYVETAAAACGETAQAALTLSSNSGTICGTGTATFTVSGGSGSGALSVSSSDETKATASIDGSTVTVTGVAAGSATITVTKACDATYAEKTATYSATVAAIPTANAGVDKVTEPGEGVALAATAAASGCTGVWTIQSGLNTATSQLSSTTSATATFTPTAAGTYTLRWTVTNSTSGCSAYDDMTVTAAVCSISECGNATLTYPLNVGTSLVNTAANLVSTPSNGGSAALTVPAASAAVTLSTITISDKDGDKDNKGKAAATTSACYPTAPTMSSKIGMYNGASYSSSNYLQFAFTVNSGYTFTPCDIEFTVQPVSHEASFRWEVTDGTNIYGYGVATDIPVGSSGGASVMTGLTSTTEMATGDYYIRLYPYYNGSNTFRISNNVILKGTTASAAPSCTAPTSATVEPTNTNGWRYSTGETIDLTCTAEGGTGTKTYQWQKYIGSTWTDINTATNASAGTAHLQIANCTSSDGGSYRCVVSTGDGCSLTSNEYRVYVFTLDGNYYGGGDWVKHPIVWNGAYTGTVTLSLTESSTFMYKVTNNDGKWYGGTSGNFLVLPAARDHYTDQTADIRLFTGPAGNYTFTIDITHFNDFPGTPYVNISVAYPTVSHPASGYAYFKKWNDWSGYYIHWWYNDGSDHLLSTWGSDPQVTTETTICGTDYIYFPVLDTYNKLIVKDAVGDATHKTGDLSSVGSSGKYFDFTNDNAWNTFTTYTVTTSISPAGYGTVSAASVTGVACGTSISASTNTLTVGATNVTATPAAATAEYTYAFDNWAWTPAGATVTSDVTATANFTRTPKSYTLTWNLAGGKVTVAGTGAAVNATGTPNSEVAFGTAITAPTVTKTGYNFSAWSSSVASTMPAANTTYTATWTAKTTTITINANTANHGSTAPSPITATYGSALPEFTAAAGTTGYVLKGYYTDATDGTKIINANGTLVASTTYTTADGKWNSEAATLTLFAQYEEEVDDCYSEVAKVTLTGKDSAPTCTGSYSPSGAVSGLQDGNATGYYKLGGKPSYVKLQLGGGNTFQAGDSIILEIRAGDLDPATGTGEQTSTPVRLFTNEGTTAFYTSSALTANTLHIVRIKVTADMISAGLSNTIYIYRTTNEASPRYSQNHQVKSIAVKHCIPSCSTPDAPTSPTNGATTSNSQAVSWTDESSDKWDVYVSTSSSAPAAGDTPIASGLTAKTYTFTGLTASTAYYWWVRSVCDDTHKSSWVAGTSFTTTAAPTLYTVTFDSNGGSTTPDAIEQASEDASITMPAAPTYSGHTFQGWVIGGTTYAAGASYTPTANVTAYASWKETCAGSAGNSVTIVPATGYSNQVEKGSTNVTFTSAPTLNYKYKDENNETVNSSTDSRKLNNAYGCTIASNSSYRGSIKTTSAYDNVDSISFYFAAPSCSAAKVIVLYSTDNFDKDSTTLLSATAIATSNKQFRRKTLALPVAKKANALTFKFRFAPTSAGMTHYIDSLKIYRSSGYSCYYVTYNGNGAEAGSISDAEAYASGSNVTVLGNTGGSAFTKTGYRFNGWNTSATGNGTSYAAGATISSISANVTLYAQWVADACSAPSEPTISGTSVRTVGQTIELTAFCESGKDARTTYTWYKGDTWDDAAATTPVQDALTIEEGGRIFNKASCASGDAGTYWCEASNGDGCAAHNATGFTVTVNAAVATHIYYYKDADHYDSETDTYYNPEGNTATLKDNQNLFSPWTICNACMTGVDSVVAHGATYDGKGNHMNAYIKLPTGGDATKNNIKFALSAGYTGTLTIKIGGYNSNPTVSLYKLTSVNGAIDGDAVTPTSGEVGGVATTENNFNAITWPLSTAGGTYVLTVTTKTGYISQIDMTTETSANFNVTYNGNGNTGGTVPTDATNYDSGATVTVAANTGDGKLVKENYTGAGWNTANNGTGTNYVPGSGTFKITANTTLYAHWTQLITLAPGTQGTGTNNAAVSWNGSVLRGFAAHTASGYALQGYYTEPSGGTKVLNADGSFAATDIDGFVTSGKWSNIAAAPTLYAQWEASNLLKWNLKVNVSETSITTLSKESAAPTVIAVANMGNLTNNGSLTITGSAKSGLTSKIATTASAADENAGKYMSVQFIVAAGYQLVPSDIKVKVQPISHSQTTKLILEDNNSQSISYTSGSLSKGSTHTVTMTNSEEVAFTGTVTLKIYVYGTAESDGYRLGTPIEINGSVEATCTPPTFSGLDYSATEYTQSAVASAISVTGAANVDSYQWKYNTVNDRTSGTDCGTGASVTPSTESTGTLYYWCELTNTCTTVKTAAVGITVRNATTDPTVAWSNVKLGATDDVTPNYGGGNYVLRATVNETSWTGTLAASMITAPAGIRIHHVTTGKADNKNYIEFKFDVTTAFDRASNATIDFNLALPEAGSYSALNSVKSVTYNDCSGGAAGQVAIKMGATASTSKSNPQNYWETAGAGRLMFNYGSNMGSTNNPSGYKTADSTFYYYAASTGQKWMFQTYIAGVNKVRVVFRAAGTIKSSKATITNFYYNTEYFASPGSNAVSFGDVNANKAGYSSGEDGYIEFTVPEMAANSYGAFVTADGNMKVYGVVLYTENAGGGGSVATNPAWSDSKTDGFTVNKSQGDANFTYTISTTTNTLGAITYSSSNPSVAAVDPVTGEVTITATGESAQSTVITATLARSGCYQGATRTYTINVTGLSCSDVAGTISTEDLGCDGIKMTLSGYTEGASIQWYKDGETIADDGGEANVYTATSAGRYYAVTHKDCNRTSNTVEIADKSVSATREISKWYIKNGRPTPDIKLWTLGKGTHLTSVAWSPDNGTGLTGAEDIYERDGAVWLTGREPNTNSGEDVSYTLTLTVNNGCSENTTFSDASQKITIVHQKNTDKHVLAFVVNGTAKGDFTEGITAAQTTSVGLYNAIAAQFDVQATNIYATDDEKKLKEYYSQYDILCITDYPNTQTKGANSKSYVDAIGALIDIRPILTMEAFVSALPNWKLKGVSGNPKSPSTRQYTMLLQCKDHEIFSGTTLTKVGEGEDAMYRVTMVDKNQEEYKTLDANYGDGEHKANEGYQYGKKPALQGFTYTEEMSDNDMLPLGLIDDGAGNDLQVGIERQKEMSARMMVLGINSYAMERLDKDGEAIVINALKYLMKKSAEDISDCSVYFDGSDETDPTNWDNELNWGPSYASLPLPHQEVRILKECVVKDGVVARASGIKIIPRGRINHDTDDASGSLTIEPGGALIVDGKVRAAVAPNYFTAIQTTPADLYIAADETKGNGTLIFDNEDGETQATVGYYSKATTDENTTWNWQYMAVPFNDNSSAHRNFYDSYLYRWAENCSGWEVVPNQGAVYPWVGYTITQVGQKMYYMDGTLVETGEQTFTVPAGKNLVVGNSWTAPIQVKQFEDADFAGMSKNVYLFNTGYDPDGEGAFDKADGRYEGGTYVTVPIHASSYTGDSLISSLQAFTVYATEGGGGGTFTLNYDRHIRPARTTDNLSAGPMHAPKRGGVINDKPAVLKVWASGSRYDDRLVVLEREDFSTGLDEGWDGNKRVAGNSSPLIFAVTDNGREAVSAIPTMEGTLIGFWAGEDNEYRLHFEYDEEDELYLLDLDNNTYTPVNSNSTYVFTVPDKKAHNRFILTRNAPNPVATGVEETQASEKPEAKAIKFLKDEKVFIFVNGKLYDATGKIVK